MLKKILEQLSSLRFTWHFALLLIAGYALVMVAGHRDLVDSLVRVFQSMPPVICVPIRLPAQHARDQKGGLHGHPKKP